MSITTEDLKIILDAAIKLSTVGDAAQCNGFKVAPGSEFDVTKFVCDVIESTKKARFETAMGKASAAAKVAIDSATMQCTRSLHSANKKQSVDNA